MDGVEKERLPVALNDLGTLTFTDGRLVVGDPYLMEAEPVPISREVSTQPYAVLTAVAQIAPGHPRIAAAMLVAGDAPIVSWEMAHWPDQDPASLKSDGFFGYGVDAGTGFFASLPAARVAGRVLFDDAGMLEDPVSAALFSGAPAAGAALVAPEADAAPIAVFSSGWGDGLYPTWLGLNENGDVAVVVTDFLLTGDPHVKPEPAAEEPPAPPTSRWKRVFRRAR